MLLGIVVLLAAAGAGAAVIALTRPSRGGGSANATAATSAGVPAPAGHTSASPRVAHRHHGAASGQTGSDSNLVNAALHRSSFVTAGVPRHRVMALTFDDGPGPYTPAIVRTLVRTHTPATFFIVGQSLTDFSSALQSELRHGFDIGDHTENHAWLIHLDETGQLAQIHDAASRLERLGVPAPRLFRPPYGAFDTTTLALLHRMRMFMVLWSVDPGDWRRPGRGAIVSGVLSHAQPGAVVILHDAGGDRSQTVAALPAIINGLRRRHYDLVTVPRLLALDPPPRHQQAPHLSGV